METIAKRILPRQQRRFLPADERQLGFGDIFSDHMFLMDYHDGRWQAPRIEPFAPLQLSPAAMGLHYAQLIFEGLKCYRRADGRLALFRPKDNFVRFAHSAQRLCIPDFDQGLALAALKELLLIDQAWVPSTPGASLYIRPFIVATEPHLGVRPAREYLFMIITGPVGPYYPEGFAPINIYVEPQYSRTAPGGLGEIKAAANYAASLFAAEEAHKKGYTQILWLDPCHHKYVEEVGSMNMFFVLDGELLTSPLAGTVLPGITRQSVLTLAKDWGLKVAERPLPIEEIIGAQESGLLTEAFGTGTAAVVSPVGRLHYQDQDLVVGGGQTIGPLTQRLYDEITGIQYGLRPDSHDWIFPLT
ncbi:MAG: branched-chain amino acid aminotransferase [Candidatus Adiutrix sp.]|jgi:branched-chain amino acid aminotransferase|nr:branched-chain amino acid aminotransferase [Candidatus Adiutrix sp.]